MSSFEKAFRGKYTVLSKRIDVSHGLLNHLQDRGVLNSLQVGTCKAILVEEERVCKLLDILWRKDGSLFPRFCEALVATRQQHVVDILLTETPSNNLSGSQTSSVVGPQTSSVVSVLQPMMEGAVYGSFCAAFSNIRFALVEKLDVSHGLIDHLYQRGVLLDSHVDDIRACRTETDKANKLLDLLERRDDRMLSGFLEALGATRQQSIVEQLIKPNLTANHDDSVSQPTVPQFASSAPVPTIVPAPDLDVLVTDTGEVTNGMNMNTGREIPDPAAVLGVASTGPAAGPSTVAMAPAAADVAAVQGHLVARKRHVPPPVTTPSRNALPADVMVVAYERLRDLRLLNDGAFGVVYRAEHQDWGTVAYKELKATYIKPESRMAKDLIHEAQMHALRHPNIVMLIAVVFQPGPSPFEPGHYGVVFEYVLHGGLDNFLDNYDVEWPVKLHIAQGVVHGMNYLHTKQPAPVIHGDLKVQNVLIADAYVAKICDFGLSKWHNYSRTKTHSASRRGTVTHIAPENCRDISAPRTLKFDVYSFAIMLWQLCTELVPFVEAQSEQIMAAVIDGQRPNLAEIQGPEHFQQFARFCVQSCWNTEPEQRPTFRELSVRFGEMLERNADAVRTAIDDLNAQTSLQRPID